MTVLLVILLLGACAAAGVLVAVLGLHRGAETPDAGWPGEVPSDTSLRAQLARPFEPVAARLSRRGERRGRPSLHEELARADLKVRTSEFVAVEVGVAVLAGLFCLLRFGFGLQFVIAAVGGYLLPMRYVRLRQSQRLRRFQQQLPDMLVLLANGLKAGLAFTQAMDTVAHNAPPPASEELARAVREIGMGRTAEQALNSTLRRMPSPDLELIVTAISIHSEVGGNLAHVCESVADTIRSRVAVNGQIRALTAQARLSGWIITLLPVVLTGALYVITPAYFRGMVQEPLGWVLLAVAGVLILVGNALIRRIVAIKV